MGTKLSKGRSKQIEGEKGPEVLPETAREDAEEHERIVYNSAKDAFLEGNRLFRESRFDLAKHAYSNALNILKTGGVNEDITKATALSNIAILEFADGRYEEAKKLLEEALSIRKNWFVAKKPEEMSPGVASMEMVSVALSKDNRFCRVPNEQKVLAKDLKEHGALDSVVADTMNNLAACLEVLGYLDEARPLYEESLQLRKLVHGDYSLKVAESMQNLATILDSQGHLREAEDMLEKSLSIQKDLAGESSPEAAVSMNNLGVLCTHLGKLDKAQRLLEQAVTTRILFYGDDHQLTKCAKRNLEYVKNKRKSLSERPLSENVHVTT